jgi:hypothetical protein
LNIGRFYEEPKVYLVALVVSIFISLFPFYRVAGTVLFMLTATGGIAYLLGLTFPELKARLFINTKKGNTLQNIFLALVAQAVFIAVTIGLAHFIGGASIIDVGTFLKYDKAAVTGAEVSPFANNPIFNIIIFGLMFPIVESLIAIRFLDIMLSTSKSNYTLKDYKVWVASLIIGIAAVFYHIYAKSTIAGIPNPNILVVMGVLFFIGSILAVYTKESEPAIMQHGINNILALWGTW